MPEKNPVLYKIDGIPIRAFNKISIVWSERDYAKLVKISVALKLPIAQLLRTMASPCQVCGNDKITIDLNVIPQNVGKNGKVISEFHKNKKSE